jgi:hypothetical protein
VGLDFLEDGRAFALADFDQDGRQEIFLKNRNGPQLRLLKNVIENLPPSIAFRLRGTKSNRDAIGAAVTVETEVWAPDSYASGRIRISFAAQQRGIFRSGKVQRRGAGFDPVAEWAGARSSRPSAQSQSLGGGRRRTSSDRAGQVANVIAQPVSRRCAASNRTISLDN